VARSRTNSGEPKADGRHCPFLADRSPLADRNADLLDAIRDSAVLRVRPKAMTMAVILAGLFPIMWGSGTGSEVMQRMAAPRVGGMITAPLLSMLASPQPTC